MAYLPEEKGWGPGVFQIETNTPWVGGLEGNCNKQALEFIKRLNYLKYYADEVAAARGDAESLAARLAQYDAFDPENVAAMAALALSANSEILKTVQQRMQSGEALIVNRGVISGCTVTKSGGAVRNLSLASGAFFMNGLMLPCPAMENSALVADNHGSEDQYCYAYLFTDGDGAVRFATTPFGVTIPDDGLALYRITVPAGNTGANDPYLESVTLTDIRRIETGYPIRVNSLAYASVALPHTMLEADYAVLLDVQRAKGGWNQRGTVYAGDKAANGFKVYVEGSIDSVSVRWIAIKLSL
jgi:hypothetical protein